ncbi:MAG: molybdopterin cofactor-binding domain-containing protein [Planctomycetota bacterium]
MSPSIATIENVSRRDFLKVASLAGGGLILQVFFGVKTARAEDGDAKDGKAALFAPNAFVRIALDGQVTVIANHSEMGQGTYTSIAMIVADELDADWKTVRVEAAPVDPVYNHPLFGMQGTGGSTSTWVEFDKLRQAGATARHMLVAAAAATWGVEATSCTASEGAVHNDGKKLGYGELAAKAATLAVPASAPVKDPKDWKLIGHATKRIDTPSKTDGTAQFGIDVNLPNMKVALVARPPVFGAKVKSVDDTKALAVPGVRAVLQIYTGVAVVADGFWQAKLGRDALSVVWDEGPHANFDSRGEGEEWAALAKKPGAVAHKEGDAAKALAGAAKKLEAVYELPYLSHSPMEPLNCVADVRKDGADVWTGTQFQTVDRNVAAAVTGLAPEKVKLHTTLLGGGFGRRAVFDGHFVREAVELSKALECPVKTIWTREDDIRGGYYRPRALHAFKGGLDASGAPVAWEHRIVCPSFMIGSPLEKFVVKDGIDATAVEGATELPYAIANQRIEWHNPPSGVPGHFWRSVGHSHVAFAVESFVDELAHAAGEDPLAYRLKLVAKHPRRKRLLELVGEKAGWGKPLPAGRARGVASHESFGSMTAHVVEVSLGPDRRPRVHKVTAAVDCGPIVNPDTVKAQVEGAVVFALTAALHGEITFEKGRVKQRNFHDYPMVRLPEAPEVDVHIVASTEKMGGIGEPGVPPVAPALTNALFALTGKRVRRLPVRVEEIA